MIRFSLRGRRPGRLYLASDGKHLLPLGSYAGIPIVRPRQFLEILAAQPPEPK